MTTTTKPRRKTRPGRYSKVGEVGHLFAARLYRLRIERGWSIRDFLPHLEAAGWPGSLDWSTVRRLEGGQRKVSIDEAVVLCRIYNVDLAEMLDPDSTEPPLSRYALEAQP
jgi:hypothetical protein